MTIKIILHLLAIIAGIIAFGCLLPNSYNMKVLALTFFIIAGVCEGATHFLKSYEGIVLDAELADTTKLQEAIIMDLYNVDINKYSVEDMVLKKEGELFALITSKAGLSKIMNIQQSIDDLIRRGIVQKTKLAEKKAQHKDLSENAKIINNLMLTPKGKQLAKDIIYVRSHPELNIFRPIE